METPKRIRGSRTLEPYANKYSAVSDPIPLRHIARHARGRTLTAKIDSRGSKPMVWIGAVDRARLVSFHGRFDRRFVTKLSFVDRSARVPSCHRSVR